MSKAKDIEAALECAMLATEGNTIAEHKAYCDDAANEGEKALTALRKARESVDLEQLREALGSDVSIGEYEEKYGEHPIHISVKAAQAWLDFMEGE